MNKQSTKHSLLKLKIIKTWKWLQNWEQSKRKSVQAYGSLIVHDTFEAHEIENVKAVFANANTHLALIPGRLTSVLQSLVFHDFTVTEH